jgi:hypothetical protein
MLFTAGGSAFGQSGTDALFFAHSGIEKLPVMLLLAGGLMFVVSIVVIALHGLIPRQSLFLLLPLVAGGSLLVERAVLIAAPSWVYAVVWLSASVVVMLQWLFTWGLLGMLEAPGVRYVPVDGELELLPGLRLVPAPGHTPGTQVVVVETGGRPVVIGGDMAVWFGELDEPHTEGQLLVRALDPELVWLAHEHEPWRPSKA